MRKDISVLIIIMAAIISFITGYSMSPTETRECTCHKDEPCAKEREAIPVDNLPAVETKKPLSRVTPAEKQPEASVAKKQSIPKETEKEQTPPVEDTGGYGAEGGGSGEEAAGYGY